MEEMMAYYTYKQGRKCLKCQKPIPDQVHGSRKYCEPKRLPDGTIDSCKDDYHIPIRKKRNAPFDMMAKHHRLMYERIDQLYKAKGDIVTSEHLNIHGISLNRPFQFDIQKGKFIFYYYQYAIKDLGNKQYQIFKHELF
jgi:hypothetical protein